MSAWNQIAKLMALVLLITGGTYFLMGQAAPSKKPPQPKVASEAASVTARPKPEPEDFETIEDYSEALMNWKHERQLGTGGQPGRFQIVINPSMRADTFLLDTQTGRVWEKVRFVDMEGEPWVWLIVDRLDNSQEIRQWQSRQTPKKKIDHPH